MKIKKPLGIYVHIPFCKSKCTYCDFYSLEYNKKTAKTYVSSVITHIDEYKMLATTHIIDTIYIGGGTPSVIGYKNLIAIIKQIKKTFSISKNIEIAVELNPESTDKKLLKKLKRAGVSRISFGVQTSNDEKLAEISRLHTFDTAREVISIAKRVGFTNISIDLIYGLVGQTMDDLRTDIANFIALDVEHISTYALKIEEGTQLFNQNPTPLDDDLYADMYEFICKSLRDAGYNHYEISNFCKGNNYSRHNMKYWNLDEYIGLGPSAHSFACNVRYGHSRSIEEYINNREITEREEKAEIKTRFGEYIMLKLRTTKGIDTDIFYEKFKKDFNDYKEKCEPFIKSGHAEYKNGCFYLTEKGLFISNYIINQIIN